VELFDKIKDYFRLIGKLISKALLENITINLCFNKLIYKIILSEKITFEDLIFINKPVDLKKFLLKPLLNVIYNQIILKLVVYITKSNKIDGKYRRFVSLLRCRLQK